MSHDHMHFVDGAAGGYALAAMQLKNRAQQAEPELAVLTP
jgi:hypothetical protein